MTYEGGALVTFESLVEVNAFVYWWQPNVGQHSLLSRVYA